MKFIDNYWRKTPKKWRKLGDGALALLVTVQTVIMSAPADVLTPRESYWITSILTISLTIFKLWTNTHTENED